MKPTQWEEIQRDIDALAHTNPSHEEWIMWIERNFKRAITLAEDRGLERAADLVHERVREIPNIPLSDRDSAFNELYKISVAIRKLKVNP